MGDDEFAIISTPWKTATLILLITLCPLANAADPPEVMLSPAEAAVISRQVGNLKSSTDANVAMGWSNAKKVAELICRPTALFPPEEADQGSRPGIPWNRCATNPDTRKQSEADRQRAGSNTSGLAGFYLHLQLEPGDGQGDRLPDRSTTG